MTFVHGKNTFVSVNANDISPFANASSFKRSADEHDTTTYGKDSHVFFGGLKAGSWTVSGVYDNTGAGPRAILRPLLGTVVPFIRRVEGTGTGKPQDAGTVHVKSYDETSPVADMVAWAAELTISDTVTSTTQP